MLDLFDLAIAKAINGDSGGEAVLINKSISANGEYSASSDGADGYKKVTVSVPNTYAAGDEGKVVDNGALVAQTAHATVAENGTIDTTLNNSVEVAVPVPTLESKSISANGTYTPEAGKAWNEVVVTVSASPRTANGTFTIASSADYMPIVQHNLGTDKIAFVIYPDSIEATAGYKTYFLSYFPWNYYMGNDVWQLDFSSYNSNFTEPISVDGTERSIRMRSGTAHTSPWESQKTWYAAEAYVSTLKDDDVTITNSTLRTITNVASIQLVKGTYKWVAVALE